MLYTAYAVLPCRMTDLVSPPTTMFDLFAPGTMLGRYELVAAIGEGGMARVILARQRGPAGFEKVVVVKVIHPKMAEDKAAIGMLLDEARVAAQISHPHVVQTFELGEAHGTFYIVMEYLAGESLQRVLKQATLGSALDPRMAARIVADAADGLHAAHELCDLRGQPLSLVHRDVSLGNIVVLYNGCVKVVDFGIAKTHDRISTHTQTGQLKGKYSYMSPEQIRNEPLDRRSDVFSLGVVLWECLALRRLFHAPNVPATLVQILEGERVPPSQFNPAVPPALDAIALKALAIDPRDRFQSAAEMKRALEDAIYESRCDASDLQMYMTAVFGDRIRKRQALLASCNAERPTVELDACDLGFEQTSGISQAPARGTEAPSTASQYEAPSRYEQTPRPVMMLPAYQEAPQWLPPSYDLPSGQLISPPIVSMRPSVPAMPPRKRPWLGLMIGAAGILVGIGLILQYLDKSEPTQTVAADTTPTLAAGGISRADDVTTKPAAKAPIVTPLDEPDADSHASVRSKLRPEHLEPIRVVNEPVTETIERVQPAPPRTPSGPTAKELYKRASELYVGGNLVDAEIAFRQVLAVDRGYAPAYRGLGYIYQSMGFEAKAIDSLRRYLKLVPKASDADQIRDRIDQMGGQP
jgi:serine/threonine protein kinase